MMTVEETLIRALQPELNNRNTKSSGAADIAEQADPLRTEQQAGDRVTGSDRRRKKR
jgi:hypothetical protein